MSTNPAEPAQNPWPHAMPVGALRRSRPAEFDLIASDAERLKIAEFLGLADLQALRFRGVLEPEGSEGWAMKGRLTASLMQFCVVTLEPVPAKVDEEVLRQFIPDDLPAAIDIDPEAEDEPDTFADRIDPGAVAIEILALSLDPYPRADGVEPVDLAATPPGAAVLDETVSKPFAGLAELKARLEREK